MGTIENFYGYKIICSDCGVGFYDITVQEYARDPKGWETLLCNDCLKLKPRYMSTANSTLPAKINGELSPELQKKLDVLIETVPKDRQLSWLQLSNVKLATVKKMEAEELKLQPLLKDYETMDVVALQKAVDAYKAGYKIIPEIRTSFTKHLDRIFLELMIIEKRAGGWRMSEAGRWEKIPEFVLDKAEARLIELKEEEEEKKDIAANRTKELADFKAFAANGVVKIQTEYEKALNKTIVDGYTGALKQELTEDGLKQFIKVTEAAMRDVKKIAPEKFEFKYWDKTKKEDMDELMKVNKSISSPDWNSILGKYIEKMKNQFQLYWQDKGTEDAGLDFISSGAEDFEKELERKASERMAVNTLAAKGEALTPTVTNPEVKALTRKYVIVIKDTDPAWANRIVTLFLAHWGTCAPRLKLKNWGNLSIKQMAASLQEEDEQFAGLTYQEIKK
jgi:hypothetical protein